VKSADLDDVQDCIVDNKHGTLTLKIPGNCITPIGPSNAPTEGSITSFAGAISSGTTLAGDVPIVLPVGKRITAIRVKIRDNVTGPTVSSARLFRGNDAGGSTGIGGGPTLSSGAGTVQTLTLSGLPIFVTTAGALWIHITVNVGAAITYSS
jgi:hypothetical protein